MYSRTVSLGHRSIAAAQLWANQRVSRYAFPSAPVAALSMQLWLIKRPGVDCDKVCLLGLLVY